ncbi:hypothetical protein Efla_003451 [Eimeria flavescens]
MSPRDSPISHRLSVASTGAGEGLSPFIHSPESTYRSAGPYSPKAWGGQISEGLPLLPPAQLRMRAQQAMTPRPALRVAGEPSAETQLGTLMSTDIINAKARGTPLPPLKETTISMLDEGITPETARLISLIPPRTLLERTGAAMQTNDPMFTESVVQYQKEHPIPPDALQKFPNYENFPLLLNKIERPKLEPNIKNVSDVERLRGYNEDLMENIWWRQEMTNGLSIRRAYMYVPNFGRVQVVLSDFPDGTSYPLVTLPKMTPHDIVKTPTFTVPAGGSVVSHFGLLKLTLPNGRMFGDFRDSVCILFEASLKLAVGHPVRESAPAFRALLLLPVSCHLSTQPAFSGGTGSTESLPALAALLLCLRLSSTDYGIQLPGLADLQASAHLATLLRQASFRRIELKKLQHN